MASLLITVGLVERPDDPIGYITKTIIREDGVYTEDIKNKMNYIYSLYLNKHKKIN